MRELAVGAQWDSCWGLQNSVAAYPSAHLVGVGGLRCVFRGEAVEEEDVCSRDALWGCVGGAGAGAGAGSGAGGGAGGCPLVVAGVEILVVEVIRWFVVERLGSRFAYLHAERI